MISSFFIKPLQKQSALVHGTSPRYYETNEGKKAALCPSQENSCDFFHRHQIYFLRSLNLKNKALFHTHQVHSNSIYVLKDSKTSVNEVRKQKADAIVTHLPNCPIMVLTADCVPIVIFDPIKYVIGVVHAGRIGTQKQVLTNTIEALSQEYGSRPNNLILGMGPAIRGCCYEVDKYSASFFIKKNLFNSELIREVSQDKYLIDLPNLNRLEGCEAGVLEKNIFTEGPCTSCDNQRWYSYRKEGKTGRLMTLAMLRAIK